MKRLSLALACAIILGLTVAAAQTPEKPKPGPEHEKLGFFVGEWRGEGTMSESPFGPGGKTTSSDTCEWFEGKFAVVCHYTGKGPMGPMKGLGILSYNPMEKVYTYYGLDSSGQTMMTIPRGTMDGDTWNYTDESKMGDLTMKTRYIIKKLAADAYSFKWEMQGEDGTWMTVAEGKSTRQQTQAKD